MFWTLIDFHHCDELPWFVIEFNHWIGQPRNSFSVIYTIVSDIIYYLISNAYIKLGSVFWRFGIMWSKILLLLKKLQNRWSRLLAALVPPNLLYKKSLLRVIQWRPRLPPTTYWIISFLPSRLFCLCLPPLCPKEPKHPINCTPNKQLPDQSGSLGYASGRWRKGRGGGDE